MQWVCQLPKRCQAATLMSSSLQATQIRHQNRVQLVTLIACARHSAGSGWSRDVIWFFFKAQKVFHIQGPPYILERYISSRTDYISNFRQKWWKDAILIRFRWLFCHIVHCCDILGSEITLENVKILLFKKLANYQITKGQSQTKN